MRPLLALPVAITFWTLLTLAGQEPQGAAPAKGKAKGKAAAAEAPAVPPPAPQVLRLVRPNLYLVTGRGSNSVFRVTPQGVLLVDTKQDAAGEYQRLAQLVRGVTQQSVKFVFNTSPGPDRSGNNDRFRAAGAQIVSGGDPVNLGGAQARRVALGALTGVHFPPDKVLCMGDLLERGDADALDAALKLDWTLAIPATGEPVYRATVEARRRALR